MYPYTQDDIIISNSWNAVMLQLRAMDTAFPIERQHDLETGPVVLINLFTFDKADEAAMLEFRRDGAQFMQRQPWYISTQLHRVIGDGCSYLNYSVSESNATFPAAFSNPELQARLSRYPSSAVAARHLFEKIAVPAYASPDNARGDGDLQWQ